MNNPGRLGVDEMLALLDTLKSTVRDFASREEKLAGEFRQQTAVAHDAYAAQSQAQTTAAEAREQEAKNSLEAARVHIQSRFEKRRARITHAYAIVNQRMADNLDQRDVESRKRSMQGVQAAEVRRDEELANATAAHDQFRQAFGTADEELARLEKAARSAFHGIG